MDREITIILRHLTPAIVKTYDKNRGTGIFFPYHDHLTYPYEQISKLRKINLKTCQDPEKTTFIGMYLDLIGTLGAENASAFWWITGTASKNRFLSSFFDNLYYFNRVIKIIEKSPGPVVVFYPPREIIQSLDSYCRQNGITFRIISKSWYHKIPENLLQYFKNTAHRLFVILDLWQRIYQSHHYLHQVFSKVIQKGEKYYILRSWMYDLSGTRLINYHDAFFGILPSFLSKKEQNVLIVAGIMGDYSSTVKKMSECNFPIITEDFFLSMLDPLRAVLDLHKNKPKFTNPVLFLGKDISGILRAEIDREYSSPQIIRDYIHFFIVKKILEHIQVTTFTTTYENNPWEKMYYFGFKNYSPSTRVIGYQHSLLSEASINLRLGRLERDFSPLPDKIVTIGKIATDYLVQSGNYDESKVRTGCGLRFHPISHEFASCGRSKKRILLVLGGIRSRSVDLIQFVSRALSVTNRYSVTIRSHPALPITEITPFLDGDIANNPALKISDITSVAEDIENSDIIIYDASTLSLEALSMGIPVIHVALPDILSYDPLVGCEHFKWTSTSGTGLVSAIEEIYQLPEEQFRELQIKAKAYAGKYINKVTNDNLSEFL